MILFVNGSKNSIRRLCSALKMYEDTSGQRINRTKSTFIPGKKIAKKAMDEIIAYTGIQMSKLPMKYLGVPIFTGKAKSSYFDDLQNKIVKRLQGWKANTLSKSGKLVLIKSVLTSVAVHQLSVLKPPKKVINFIQQKIQNFLWDSNQDRMHNWISGVKSRNTISNGGLGIKDLNQTILAMHNKLAWKYITGDSLWASVMRQKYGTPSQAVESNVVASSSHVWKKIHPLLPSLIADSCLIEFPNASPRICWTHTLNGDFQVSKWKQMNADHNDRFKWLENYWSKDIPPKYSILIWRIFHNGLPTEDNFKKVRIPMASRCVCCAQKKEETLKHILMESDMSYHIWEYFRNIFQIPRIFSGIRHLLQVWSEGANYHSNFGFCRICCCIACIWEMWTVRNAVRHDERKLEIGNLIPRIKDRIQEMLTRFIPRTGDSSREIYYLNLLDFVVNPVKIKQNFWVSWRYPNKDETKLNFDGAYANGKYGAGGIVRNGMGEIVIVYCSSGVTSSALEAELLALLRGLEICKDLNLYVNQVEGDNKDLCNMIKSNKTVYWKLAKHMHTILKLMKGIDVNHCFREANTVANEIARYALKKEKNEIACNLTRGTSAYGCWRSDRLRLPHLRFR